MQNVRDLYKPYPDVGRSAAKNMERQMKWSCVHFMEGILMAIHVVDC